MSLIEKKGQFISLPKIDDHTYNKKSRYMYYCDNETVHGVEYHTPPRPNPASPLLISDMTSNIFSKKLNFSDYAIVYAGSQKNFGVPGITIMMVREDLLKMGKEMENQPSEFSYRKQFTNRTSTPPVFAMLFALEYFRYMKAKGGISMFEKFSMEKSQILYDLIDNSGGFYRNLIEKSCRSRMNIPCIILNDNKELTQKFIKEAEEAGLIQLGGHSSTGGLRFSIYNGMPMDGIMRLKKFMIDFQKENEMKVKL